MRAKKIKSVALLLLFFSLLVLSIDNVNAEEASIKVLDQDIQPSYATGDVIIWRVPNDPDAVGYYPSNPDLEPVSVEWTFMDSTFHIVYVDTHEPSVKQWYEDTDYTGWIWADECFFELPGIGGSKGNWYASPVVIMDDDTRLQYGTIYVVVDEDGSLWTTIFQAPIYIFGVKLPALFWCLSLVWIPLVLMGLLFVYARSAEGVAMILADARDAGSRAREEWRKKKEAKAARK